MVRNFLFLSTLCVVLFLLSCTADNPVSPGEETGSLAPQILYKAGAAQASVTVPTSILPFVDIVRIRVTPSSGAVIQRILPFAAHSAAITDIPAGAANLTVEVLDKYQFVIFAGQANVIITGGQTARPTVIADLVLARKPDLTVTQACDFGVRFSWPPCGLMSEVDIYITTYNAALSRWDTLTYLSFYAYDSEYIYNPGPRMFEAIDTSAGYAPGAYRFAAVPWFWDSRDSTWNPGPSSDWFPLTISSGHGSCGQAMRYNYGGWVYGQVGTTYLKLFRAPDTGLAPLDSLPGTPLAADTVYYPPVTPAVKFFFPALPQGRYWLYAYSNTDGTEKWQTSFKRAIYNVPLDMNKTNMVVQLDFNRLQFPNGKTLVSGNISGGSNSENIMEIGWWNEADNMEYFLGFYWVGDMDSMEVLNFPSLSDLAGYFGKTFDFYNDYFTLYFWNDADMSGSFNYGDPYYYDEANYQVGYYLDDMTAPRFVGNLTYNRTNTVVGKRQVLPKKVVLR